MVTFGVKVSDAEKERIMFLLNFNRWGYHRVVESAITYALDEMSVEIHDTIRRLTGMDETEYEDRLWSRYPEKHGMSGYYKFGMIGKPLTSHIRDLRQVPAGVQASSTGLENPIPGAFVMVLDDVNVAAKRKGKKRRPTFNVRMADPSAIITRSGDADRIRDLAAKWLDEGFRIAAAKVIAERGNLKSAGAPT